MAQQSAFGAGNTPTGVGKTTRHTACRGAARKHPHGRGEDFARCNELGASLETPPRAWGRLLEAEREAQAGRNTPTGVGKTWSSLAACRAIQKHPHGRGEDAARMAGCSPSAETPPRAWGRPPVGCGICSRGRNTPTGVGKTVTIPYRVAPTQKHPHGRGEDDAQIDIEGLKAETPPRAWGRPGGLRRFAWQYGNTPTGVGKTCACPAPVITAWKHPHGRGEDGGARSSTASLRETPPRAWGRRGPHGGVQCSCRNTPTGVGKTHGYG